MTRTIGSQGMKNGRSRLGLLGILLAAVAGIAGCSGDDRPPERSVTRASPIVPLDTGTVRVATATDSFFVSVEIAETREQQAIGLMDRDELPENEGMIFVYGAPHEGAFYMFRTRIPLDIAFFDETGRIVSIQTMRPCEYPVARLCENYSPGAPYLAALEVTGGFFASRGISVGDEIALVSSLDLPADGL